jgi:hypothetical protein
MLAERQHRFHDQHTITRIVYMASSTPLAKAFITALSPSPIKPEDEVKSYRPPIYYK